MIYATSTTQFRELATSTCNVSGANQICSYQYVQRVSTTTQQQSTIELNWQNAAETESQYTVNTVLTFSIFFVTFAIFCAVFAYVTRKLT